MTTFYYFTVFYSLRAQFSLQDSSVNALHGSDNPDNAEKELNYFFPVEHTLAVIKPDAVSEHKGTSEFIHQVIYYLVIQYLTAVLLCTSICTVSTD